MNEEKRDFEIYFRSGSSMTGTMTEKDARSLQYWLKERKDYESFRCTFQFVDTDADEVSINPSQVEAFVHRAVAGSKNIVFGRD